MPIPRRVTACWSMWNLARSLIKAILDTFLPQGIVYLAGDETVTEHGSARRPASAEDFERLSQETGHNQACLMDYFGSIPLMISASHSSSSGQSMAQVPKSAMC